VGSGGRLDACVLACVHACVRDCLAWWHCCMCPGTAQPAADMLNPYSVAHVCAGARCGSTGASAATPSDTAEARARMLGAACSYVARCSLAALWMPPCGATLALRAACCLPPFVCLRVLPPCWKPCSHCAALHPWVLACPPARPTRASLARCWPLPIFPARSYQECPMPSATLIPNYLTLLCRQPHLN